MRRALSVASVLIGLMAAATPQASAIDPAKGYAGICRSCAVARAGSA